MTSMRKTLRTALIWMLMLALPTQAMAALGMQLCQQVHRSSVMSMNMTEHGVSGMAHGMATADAPDLQQDAAPAADGGVCTLCAFCVGVAAPGEPFLNHSIARSAEPPMAWPDRLVIGVADTPERPPRPFLA